MDVQMWTSVIAAGVAVVSTGFTLWLQWWNRSQAEWSPTLAALGGSVRRRVEQLRKSLPSGFGLEFMNVGDGTAFDLSVAVDDDRLEVITLVGSSVELSPVAGAVMPGSKIGVLLPAGFSTDADHVVSVRWTSSPTRRGRRWVQTFPLGRSGFGPRGPVERASG
jgi:hypothetical protein